MIKIKKIKPVGLVIVLVVAILASLMTYFRGSREIELMLEDYVYQEPKAIPSNVKIITVDEKTLDELGPYYEWNRQYFADLINILCENPDRTPKVIGLDFIFTGTNESAGDDALAEAAAKAGNVIVASKVDISSRFEKKDDNSYKLSSYVSGQVRPYAKLDEQATSGFANMIMDSDGYVRQAYGKLLSDGEVYKSFAYLMAEKGYGESAVQIDDAIFKFSYVSRADEFETVPMSAVLSGQVKGTYFEDSIVLVGAYTEGMMDAYSVPIDYSKKMYGVEIQANIMLAIANGSQLYTVPVWLQVLLAFSFVFVLGLLCYCGELASSMFKSVGALAVYFILAAFVFKLSSSQMYLLYIPFAIMIIQITFVIYRYIMLQKFRAEEMQRTLFSMADSMAEAIEGRTPYNASHTKNVARRSVEMLDYINQLHRDKKTEMYFSEKDKKQMYLAAMLHDIGKMDVPQSVMDKPTKLGHLEKPLQERLIQIKLRLECDSYKKIIPTEEYQKQCQLIDDFLNKLGGLNCGRPLKDDEKTLIEQLHGTTYTSADSVSLPYLTDEEYNDLMIKAGTLSDNERTIMQSHVVHTDKILSHVYFGEEYKDVRHMAADHHELLNGKGYPKQIDAASIDTMTRILTIMDIYDSLIADDRPYKKPKPVAIAFKILDEEAEAGKVDKDLLEIAKEIWLKDENDKE